MIKLTHTNRTLNEVGIMLRKGLQDELKEQKHNATGRLSRGLKYHVKQNVLNVFASVNYWKAVNNPIFAKAPNFNAIQSWIRVKGLNPAYGKAIFRKLNNGNYGKPYVGWTEGNRIRRTNFAGYVANKFKGQVADKLAPSIGVDVAKMIASEIKKNNPKTNVVQAF